MRCPRVALGATRGGPDNIPYIVLQIRKVRLLFKLPIPWNANLRPSVIDKDQPIESIRSRLRDQKYNVRDICRLPYKRPIVDLKK